jgi:AcrR family transcriptional regulator
MPPKKGAINRRGVERRQAILDTATELFAQQGYRGTSMLQVAKQVGMSYAGLLHHFATKKDLLQAVLARRDQMTDEMIRESVELGPGGFLEKHLSGGDDFNEPEVLTRLIVRLRGENLGPGDPLYASMNGRSRHTRSVIAKEIRAGQRRGEFRPDLDPVVKAAEVLAFIVGLESLWVLDQEECDRKEVFKSYLDSLLKDIEAPRTENNG